MEKRPFSLEGLLQQQANIQVTCSACSAFNWLKLAGATILDRVGTELVSQVITTKTPLQETDLQKLAGDHGFQVSNYFPFENHITVKDMVNDVSLLLDQSPLLLNISTHFSKKPRNIQATFSAEDMIDSEGKIITHAVVAVKKSDDKILIIDPYDPLNPEEFDISKQEEEIRFISWIFS
ncbi:MAG: hypothetical protein US40_C0015G0025 [Candidatus Roizmanbacteria bacterium GW2011_GWC2_37_13]|uniref:Peptidase C39-like domain-containing protein n=1 Tax=Candidatus Roizmanbacteria bacterium GW2011_GWC2_37_13 TaxID=1618486 RepID=A0A0G0IK81_9BACT|nr:MAG: hypothetical protein US38_C0015G0003 [Candidatus Roizmanbacteria bacterium GW2011_GWC1_37_12]KKQ24594.1 MAG: hypothetical protein US40_C0015G0025 [Candidatus Roizmanbacteria bacterium GW2011_GWC2_37_13]